MIAWMLYSALVAMVLAAAAHAAEWLARLVGYRVRWIWAGAMALTVFLSASAVLRGARPDALATLSSLTIDGGNTGRSEADASWRRALSTRVEALRHSLDAPLRGADAAVNRVLPPAANVYATLLSALISFGLVLISIGVGRRFRRARREWPRDMMQGVGVRVAPRIGPVVIGFVRPEIIVPRWLLCRHADEQRLVVTHEDEHVRARDPLLLGVAWSAVIVAPWNPALWYMLSRLRLAVELDCDARVLRRGALPRSYGSLLIDVAQHALPLRLSAVALADDSSHLRQRILAMTPTVPRFARARAALAATFAFAAVLIACEATPPDPSESELTDVASAQHVTRKLAEAARADTTNVQAATSAPAAVAEARALPSKVRGTVHVDTVTNGGEPNRVEIRVKVPAPLTPESDSGLTQRGRPTFQGLIFIDGVRATESNMKALDKSRIEAVDVFKGPAAKLLYPDPKAAEGVIEIRTKRGAN